MVPCLLWLAAVTAASAASAPAPAGSTIAASDPRVDWAGRTQPTADGGVSFDWLGVTSRVQVADATWVSATVSSSASIRGTRLKAYISDQGFMMFPEVQFWVRGGGSNQTTDLFLGRKSARTVTLENIVDPQYLLRPGNTYAISINPVFCTYV